MQGRPGRIATRAAGTPVVLVPILPILLVLASLGGCATASAPAASAGVRAPEVGYVLPDVDLVTADGTTRNLARDPRAPVTVVFFGYTSCPDVCDLVMGDLAYAVQKLATDLRPAVEVVYVTTDPARDTTEVLAAYLARFGFPAVTGLTGGLRDVERAAEAVGVQITDPTLLPDGGYEVAHSAHLVGFGATGADPVVWVQGTSRGDLAHDLALLAAEAGSSVPPGGSDRSTTTPADGGLR